MRLPAISSDIKTAPLTNTTKPSNICTMNLILPTPKTLLGHQRDRLEQPMRDAVDELRGAGQHHAQALVKNSGRIRDKKVLLGPGCRHVQQTSFFLQFLCRIGVVDGWESSFQ